MRLTRLLLENWRNFQKVDVALRERMFIVGPNASGKSNLLDAFRFLRDIADPRGGFQQAIQSRGGVSRIRSLHARRRPDVVVEVTLDLDGVDWRYQLALGQDNVRRPVVKSERVWRDEAQLLDRPDTDDELDPGRLGQTHLEQVNSNIRFRDVAGFLAQIRYLHVVPQLIRDPDRYTRQNGISDPFGADFLEQLARMQKDQRRIFDSRIKRLNQALRVAVPQLRGLQLDRDETGRPHLRGRYEHWRPDAGWQGEDQFSDGTLRLLGLLWSVLEGTSPLLLEEPELSLHEAVVRQLPALMWTATRKSRRQLLVSTHSAALLSEVSIAAQEVLLLRPTREDTLVSVAADIKEVQALLKAGMPMGEAVLPLVAPKNPEQLLLALSD